MYMLTGIGTDKLREEYSAEGTEVSADRAKNRPLALILGPNLTLPLLGTAPGEPPWNFSPGALP